MTKKSKQSLPKKQRTRATFQQADPSNSLHPIWSFDNIDTNGDFAFDLTRDDLNTDFILGKLISYSSMTWQEILRQTHDNGKSKNHELNLDRLSQKAVERIKKKHLNIDVDSLFSFALDNIKRLIGIRKDATFQVIWYDANHEFCPSPKKHT